MLRSLYSSTTGMLTLSRRLDAISNNLSNVNTAGFKKDLLLSRSFPDMMLINESDKQKGDIRPLVGPLNLGIHVDQVVTSFDQGALQKTDQPLDVALQGQGFLTVETPNGLRYTRGGTLAIDGNTGDLITDTGYRVLGNNGYIHVRDDKFTIDDSGAVYHGDNYIDTLRIKNGSNLDVLRKEGNGLYADNNQSVNVVPFSGKVLQGSLEASNVDTAREMVDMMEVIRSYESNQRMVQMLDESLGKTVNEVGRV